MLRTMTAMLAMLALGAAASAQTTPTKSKAPKGQAYEVEFVFDGTPYAGSMVLQIAKKGGPVGGQVTIDRPTRVTGEVAGTLKAGDLALDFPYTMVEQNCTGRVVVTAKMTPKQDSAQGTATASGCSDSPVEGTFTLKKAPKPAT